MIPCNNCAFEMTPDPSKGILANKKRPCLIQPGSAELERVQFWRQEVLASKSGQRPLNPGGTSPRAAKRAPGGQKPTKHPNPGRPLGPLLACFFSFSSPSSSCVLQNAIKLDASASSGPHPFIDPDAFLPVILISILFSSGC